MNESQKTRAVLLGEYMVNKSATVRSTAKQFGISKSTVHKDLTEHLPEQSPTLYEKVRKILEKNKEERHIRGGLATKEKYLHSKML